MGARTMDATTLQRNIGATADAVRINGDTVIVTNHGRPQMVLMPYGRYTELTGDQPVAPYVPITYVSAPRLCIDCGADISSASRMTLRCRECRMEKRRLDERERQQRRRKAQKTVAA